MMERLEFGRRRIPIVLQTEAAECGLACLAMIASHHGLRVDLPALRSRFRISATGCSLSQLMSFAEALKMTSRALRLELAELANLQTPCILHWQLSHFVVLIKCGRKGLRIHDPALGVRTVGYEEVSRKFSGFALELSVHASFEVRDLRRRVPLKSLIGKVDGLWRAAGSVIVMALAIEAFALAAPRAQQWIVDEALVTGDRALLNVVAIGMLLMLTAQTVLAQARGWTLMYYSTCMGLNWSGNVFGHLMRLPMEWFQKRHLGDILSRFGATATIQQTLTASFLGAVLDGFMAVAAFSLMLLYSPVLSMIVIAGVAGYAVLRALFYRPLLEATAEQIAMAAKEQSCFVESMRAMQAIKLSGCELERKHRWINHKVDTTNRGVRVQKLGLHFASGDTAVSGLTSILTLLVGSGMVLDGRITLGMWFAFASYSGMFSSRVTNLTDHFIQFKMLSLHVERLADIMLEKPESFAGLTSNAASRLAPRIELIDVGYRYGDTDPWVLRHVNLCVEPGDSVAITGPSGGGKTTLIKLILGLIEPTEGEIRYGGVPVKQIGMRCYRAQMAAVMQDDQLLAGSLADNISFFAQPCDREHVVRCAVHACVHEDIARMPMQYESLVGDMGSALSGGQRQRLLLARALYRNPKVLVLDEATSHLDVALEKRVNISVSLLAFTRIIIAHRPETIAAAGRVFSLQGGSVHSAELPAP